ITGRSVDAFDVSAHSEKAQVKVSKCIHEGEEVNGAIRRRSRAGIAVAGVAALALAGSLGMRLAPASHAAAASHCSAPTLPSPFFGKAFDLFAHKQLPVFRYTLANANPMPVKI